MKLPIIVPGELRVKNRSPHQPKWTVLMALIDDHKESLKAEFILDTYSGYYETLPSFENKFLFSLSLFSQILIILHL
jgi:hypothetical protein